MSEQAFDVFDALKHAEHYDHIGPHRGFSGEFVDTRVGGTHSAFLAALAGANIAAAIRQQSPQCRARTEIEDARAGGNELRGKLGARIGFCP